MSKNKIPFLHEASLRILRIEREELVKALGTIKRRINHLQFLRMNEPDDFEYFSWVSKYGGNVSKLTKRQTSLRDWLQDVEASIQLLKEDGQRNHQAQFEAQQRQALWDKQQFASLGSYNCAYGC